MMYRTQFKMVDCEQMDNVAKEFFKKLQVLGRQIKHWTVWSALRVRPPIL